MFILYKLFKQNQYIQVHRFIYMYIYCGQILTIELFDHLPPKQSSFVCKWKLEIVNLG